MPLEIPRHSQNRHRQGDLIRLFDDLLPQSLQQSFVLVRRELEILYCYSIKSRLISKPKLSLFHQPVVVVVVVVVAAAAVVVEMIFAS